MLASWTMLGWNIRRGNNPSTLQQTLNTNTDVTSTFYIIMRASLKKSTEPEYMKKSTGLGTHEPKKGKCCAKEG